MGRCYIVLVSCEPAKVSPIRFDTFARTCIECDALPDHSQLLSDRMFWDFGEASGEYYLLRRRNGIRQAWEARKPHVHLVSTELYAVFEVELVDSILRSGKNKFRHRREGQLGSARAEVAQRN